MSLREEVAAAIAHLRGGDTLPGDVADADAAMRVIGARLRGAMRVDGVEYHAALCDLRDELEGKP